jgi:hypothetical protein
MKEKEDLLNFWPFNLLEKILKVQVPVHSLLLEQSVETLEIVPYNILQKTWLFPVVSEIRRGDGWSTAYGLPSS